jgi:two-component system sensor histidine kinase YesM
MKLVDAFKEVEQGNLDISADHRGSDEFAYLFRGFNSMVNQLKRLIDQVLKQKILAQRSELKQLQSQINPHFLYNSFFILHGMVLQRDYENLEKFSRQLGSYYQFLTRSTSDEIPLQREVEHARTYAEIQARRFRNRIRLEFGDLPEDRHELVVPRLIIQPLLENAFEHGLRNKISDGVVSVRFVSEPERFAISVADNGDEIDEQMIVGMRDLLAPDGGTLEALERSGFTEHTGLANVHRRLQLKFGKDSGLRLRLGEAGGLEAELVIVLR